MITVADNGIGFKEEFSDKVFDVFTRLHHHDDYGGSGIGLALCRRILVNHGGMITASGEEGKGATFTIYLPHVQGSFPITIESRASTQQSTG
jgi:signal transduction histidine kinase